MTFFLLREGVAVSSKERNAVEERLRFVARLLDGEEIAGLCRDFGISRKTGYKTYQRYQNPQPPILSQSSADNSPSTFI